MAATTPRENPFEKLRRAREASGDSVESLAAKAGVDPGWLARVESGAEPDDDQALGLLGNALSINLDDLFGRTRRRRTTTRTRTTGSRSTRTTRTASGDMDGAVRAAVRAEMAPVERLIRDLVEELGRLRRAQEDTADRVARLSAGGVAKPAKKAARKAARR